MRWLLILGTIILFSGMALADVSGPKGGSSCTGLFDDWPDEGWDGCSSTYSSNNTRNLSMTLGSDIYITGFNMGVPTGATITKFEVNLEGFSNLASGTRAFRVRFTKDGTNGVGAMWDQTVLLRSTDTVYTDNVADMLGMTCTPAEANASTFGVIVENTSDGGHDFCLDYLSITVTYTPPAPVKSRRFRLLGRE